MAITARVNSFGPLFVLSVVASTAVVAAIASLGLLAAARVAPVSAWLLAGVLVPVAAVFGFLGTTMVVGRMLAGTWSTVMMSGLIIAVALTITVPLGIFGHLLLRWLIKSLFYSSRSMAPDNRIGR